jgi:hypothetical protein
MWLAMRLMVAVSSGGWAILWIVWSFGCSFGLRLCYAVLVNREYCRLVMTV